MEKQRRPIFQPNELSEATVVSMRTRIIAAIVGIAIVLPIALFGDWAFFALACLAAAFAVIEIIRCAKRKYSKALYITAFILALLVLSWNIIRDIPFQEGWRLFDSYNTIYISITIIFIGLCLASFTVMIDKGFTVVDATFIFTIVLLISLGFQSCLFLRFYPSYLYHQQLANDGLSVSRINLFDNLESSLLFIWVAVGACLNDAFAYFVGVFFGKNKLNERISPKKTWEGFFGGIILTSLVLTGWALLQDVLSHGEHAILTGVLDIKHFYHVIVLSILIPLVSVLGDLVFSSIKRFYGIKDFSNLMPGHGGILDRADSILFATITAAIYICIFYDFASTGIGGIILP